MDVEIMNGFFPSHDAISAQWERVSDDVGNVPEIYRKKLRLLLFSVCHFGLSHSLQAHGRTRAAHSHPASCAKKITRF